MKSLFMFLIFSIGGYPIMSNSLSDYTNEDLESYRGKEVSEFIDNVSENYNDFYFIQEPPGKIQGVTFYYDKYKVLIYISTRNYIKSFDINMSWNLTDFMNEEIERIIIQNVVTTK